MSQRHILVVASTFPASDSDPVPSFVKEQVIALKKNYPHLKFSVLAPHNAESKTRPFTKHEYYDEYRFHYFWPWRFEKLAGRGILPSLKKNRWLYLEIPFFAFFELTALLRLVLKLRPQLIYAHWFTPQAISSGIVSTLIKTPFVFTTHASDVKVLARIPFGKSIVRWTCSRASAYTAVSNRTAEKLEMMFKNKEWRSVFSKKLTVVPMGVSTNTPTVRKKDIVNAKKRFNIPADKKYLLFLGRLAEKKGVKYLLEAFSMLPDKVTRDIHLIIAGDGQLRDELEYQAKFLNIKNITFTGYVHGKYKDALLILADYVCIPSIIDSSGDSEGMPVVLMEALAAGKIVLASNVSGAENFIESGISGYVFPEKSIESLSQKLVEAVKLNSDEESLMRKKSKALAKQFDWNLIAKRHYQVLIGSAL